LCGSFATVRHKSSWVSADREAISVRAGGRFEGESTCGIVRETLFRLSDLMSGSIDIASIGRGSEIAVVGTGPTGLGAALALGHVGASVIVLGPAPQNPASAPVETRTAALLASSVDLLKRLDVWNGLKSETAPLKVIRIIDASKSLLRAPDIE